ncbi:hypothetical protein BH11BAC4_BH11BAC4_08270 [soil metagenome]
MKAFSMAIFAGLFSLVSCSSTQVTSSWKAGNLPNTQYKKIMVFGIIQEKDRTMREELENALVSDLKAQGYDAVSALEEYGPKAFSRLSEEEIADRLKNSGYDAVLTTVLLDKSKEQNYTPGNTTYRPAGIARFGRYYTTIYDRVYTPGYYTTSTNFFLESNFYDTKSGDLVYSVQSRAFDPSSAATLSSDYAKTVVTDMKKNGVIGKK